MCRVMTLTRAHKARFIWRARTLTYVSFPTLARTFRALARLVEAGRPAEYDGSGPFGRYWIRIYRQ